MGAAIVLVSLVQGIVLDVVLYLVGHGSFGYALGGGMAAASNVIVFQILYFSGAPWGISSSSASWLSSPGCFSPAPSPGGCSISSG